MCGNNIRLCPMFCVKTTKKANIKFGSHMNRQGPEGAAYMFNLEYQACMP